MRGARQDLRGARVAQVPEPAADARLERSRIGRRGEQVGVVVALQQQRVAAAAGARRCARSSSRHRSARRAARHRRRTPAAAARRHRAAPCRASGAGRRLRSRRHRARSAAAGRPAAGSTGRRRRRPGRVGRWIARQVPRLIHSAIRCRRASATAQPTWSPCSCVMKIASICSTAVPARASRCASSRCEKPQSIRTRRGAPAARGLDQAGVAGAAAAQAAEAHQAAPGVTSDRRPAARRCGGRRRRSRARLANSAPEPCCSRPGP